MRPVIIYNDTCPIGFKSHLTINPLRPVRDDRIKAQYVYGSGDITDARKAIEFNSSLRVDFNWSFESSAIFKKVINEAIEAVYCPFGKDIGEIVSDNRCSWFGFLTFNVFDRIVYEDFDPHKLIKFNDALIEYQIKLLEFITSNQQFLDHSILRNHQYRFELFKNSRKDKDALVNLFNSYMSAIKNVCAVEQLPRDILEEQIGCHFIYNPEIFFELLDFYILKGDIYE